MVASDSREINAMGKFIDGKKHDMISKTAFMFPGQGAQYISMGKDLYKSSSHFSKILDECFEIIKSETGEDMHSLLFDTINTEERELRLARPEFNQPALFIIEYALVKILEQINVRPDYLVGHDVGEYTAACVAGVFDMQSALKIVIKRGQITQRLSDPLLSDFMEYVDQFNMKSPVIPFISCLTGKFITPEEAVASSYWAQQLCNTVQFHNGITLIGENDDVLFLEVGPNAHLSSLVGENSVIKNKKAIIPTLGIPDSVNETYKLIDALGRMYNAGLEPEYPKLNRNGASMKISLPTYPFNKERHWIDFEYSKAFDNAD
jgi:acyl transferase domain-containing protein